MRNTDEGSILPLIAAGMLLAGLLTLGVGRVGQAAVAGARARTAADAAALAGATDGRSAAEELARANGARMTAFERVGPDVRVTVRVGDAAATARARPGGSESAPSLPGPRPVRWPR